MRKIDPVRALESQMASLRQSYELWVDDTPELESDRPSEEEMAEFEEAEGAHGVRSMLAYVALCMAACAPPCPCQCRL